MKQLAIIFIMSLVFTGILFGIISLGYVLMKYISPVVGGVLFAFGMVFMFLYLTRSRWYIE